MVTVISAESRFLHSGHCSLCRASPFEYNAPVMSPDDRLSRPSAARFDTTHWSVVLTAGESDTPQSRQALAQLCETYWYPLYAYLRRKGRPAHDAEDLS